MSLFNNAIIGASGQGGYRISRSVRLRSSANAYFSKTFASSSGTTNTFSFWVKRGKLGSAQSIFDTSNGSTTSFGIFFNASDSLEFYDYSSAYRLRLVTTQVFRDPSAWYHIICQLNTTNATSSNRAKVYVNGVEVTAFSTATYPTQNTSLNIGSLQAFGIGVVGNAGGQNLDGYLTEFNFIDGQALTPSSFGETNAITGVWQPKRYTGTYGTNGFYLNFSDNSGVTATTIGKDYSGNGNNWTPNNISITAGATYDSMLDVPTPYADGGNGRGNYCVLNPLDWVLATNTITDGNLNITTSASNTSAALGTIAVSSGKWYFEFTPTSVTGIPQIGIVKTPVGTISTNGIGQSANAYVYLSNGNKGNNNSFTAYGATYTNADVIGVALDLDAGTLVFYKNNASQGTAFTSLSGEFFPVIGDAGAASTIAGNINFGQRPFTYTPPTGFVALNTQNLPTPTISNGATVMAATLYTGNATARTIDNSVNGVSFQPDWVWIKSRSATTNNQLVDAVRGTSLGLSSNLTSAEYGVGVNAFASNGFGLTTDGSLLGVNVNAATYVAWQWNAGGSTVTNTSGSISSQVRANPTAGFSVVTYTGNGVTAATVGHGLNAIPAMVIIKERGTAGTNWMVKHQSLASSNNLFLQGTNATTNITTAVAGGGIANLSSSTTFNFLAGTSNTDNVNRNTGTFVAYCFAAVAGYSAFGSYTGNGSADGPFVYCGFRPRWVMVKRTDVANDWAILDTARNTFNVTTQVLFPNSSAAEGTQTTPMDILSNGFKVRNGADNYINANGGTYIYAAFAESPFKLALAR